MPSLREGEPLPPSEDYVIAQTAESDDADLVVAPPDGKTPDEAAAELNTPPDRYVPSLAPAPEPPRSAFRFSLFELFAAMTFISIALAGASWLQLEHFVGITGLFTVLCIVVFFVLPEPDSRITKLAWWTLVATYIFSAAVALVRVLLR